MSENTELRICRFLNDAPCAYSMTYDEGFIYVLANGYPIHKKYNIPGHLDVVVGQLGQRRNCLGSSMNGIFHMGVEHLKFLISEGWSVGNHSYSHFCYPNQPGLDLYKEVVNSKYLLEDMLECPITLFTIPNDMCNYEPALPYIKQAGYLGCHAVDGGVNYDDVDLLKIGNFLVASGILNKDYNWPEKLLTENIKFEDIKDGWLCETTHLVMPNTIQPRKNITPEDLDKRLAKLQKITNGNMWAAVPEDVIDYILMRRNTKIVKLSEAEFEVRSSPPLGVRKRNLSFSINRKITGIHIDDQETAFTIDENNNSVFSFSNAKPCKTISIAKITIVK